MCKIAAKEFVRALAAQRNRCPALAELGKKPDRKCSGVGARFVRVISKLRDRVQQIQAGIHIDLLVLCLIALYDLPNMGRFIEAASVTRDGKSLEPGAGC